MVALWATVATRRGFGGRVWKRSCLRSSAPHRNYQPTMPSSVFPRRRWGGNQAQAGFWTHARPPTPPRRVARVLPCATIFATSNLPSLPIFRPFQHPVGCKPRASCCLWFVTVSGCLKLVLPPGRGFARILNICHLLPFLRGLPDVRETAYVFTAGDRRRAGGCRSRCFGLGAS